MPHRGDWSNARVLRVCPRSTVRADALSMTFGAPVRRRVRYHERVSAKGPSAQPISDTGTVGHKPARAPK
jgi:hypothetical protein